ncbi:MAG: transglycosylase SLT domain-containing protein [Candidatus Tectomicrobia bacterium]|uniref:Transglycosylase SLT domain-containing protein n=1 Tax=Tectimicrobiota bacterium TaxID=2528274 RepID=A0A932CLX2_UNCTE|nr:transglycosylase SLT domain-containing protein [Candidatus Tectomicrobia bacterium]
MYLKALCLVLAIAVLLLSASLGEGREKKAKGGRTLIDGPSGNSVDPFSSHILKRVGQAKKLLHSKKAGHKICHTRKKAFIGKGMRRHLKAWAVRYPCGINFLIAVVGKAEVAKKNGKVEFIRLKPGQYQWKGFSVVRGRPSGVGTRFIVKYPQNYIVLATKSAVKMGQNGTQEVVNTPYSQNLDLPGIRRVGLNYLTSVIKEAKGELRRRRVYSRAIPGKLVADIIPVRVAVVIGIDEHIDHYRFLTESPGALIREVKVILGANKSHAYRWSVSSAGARGLWQVMPGTYRDMRRLYPRARLNSSFISGMNDHKNAAMAALCLLDFSLAQLRSNHLNSLKRNPRTLGRYLAAAYNCGPGCARHRLERYGKNWTGRLPSEARLYVRKFDTIWNTL